MDKTDIILEEAFLDDLDNLESNQSGSIVYFSQISSRPSEDDYLEEDEE